MCGEGSELVRRRHEGQARQLGDLGRAPLVEVGRRVEACPDGGTSDRELVQAGEREPDALEACVELGDVAAELLPQRQRHRVLEMGAPRLDDVAELLGLHRQGIAQGRDGRDQAVHDLLGGGDVHRGREGVVRRLRHVHVVVGVDRRLAAAFAAGELDGAVRDHLVDVHVRLRPTTGLPDVQRELVVVLAVDDLVGGLHDQLRLLGRELAEVLVGEGGGLLEDGHAPDDGLRHAVVADGEMMERPLRLRPPVPISRHLDLAEAVRLPPCRIAAHTATVPPRTSRGLIVRGSGRSPAAASSRQCAHVGDLRPV